MEKEQLISFILSREQQYTADELRVMSERQLVFIKVRIELEEIEKPENSGE